MVEPRVIPRAEHPISRRNIDPDALKVLYRLRQFGHLAYLVGGSVRDLLLGRRPKDFDIGTSAHPYQVKRLFRPCWIVGRRFRLAHVKFGTKTIEVATFRRQVPAGAESEAPDQTVGNGPAGASATSPAAATPAAVAFQPQGPPSPERTPTPAEPHDHLIHHDNTFGTPEEDAFRRDFTINALFYDVATFSIIDYVGGLDDLQARLVRAIGDPEVRFLEDPVRMLRAVALACRLDFDFDPPVLQAIQRHRHAIARASPPRLLEEYYKILRSGAAEKTFRRLADAGLLEPISIELHRGASEALWDSLAELDAYRTRYEATPDTLTNPILLGSLLVPLGLAELSHRPNGAGASRPSGAGADTAGDEARPGPKLGELPLARRDLERLHQVIVSERRLHDLGARPRAERALTHRPSFRETLTWLEIHGHAPAAVEHWKGFLEGLAAGPEGQEAVQGEASPGDRDRPRRGRRRRRRRRPPHAAPEQ